MTDASTGRSISPSSAAGPDPAGALAAAVRDCLIAGRVVALPGLGALRREHEPARVEVRRDGHHVLLPPRATIRFEPV